MKRGRWTGALLAASLAALVPCITGCGPQVTANPPALLEQAIRAGRLDPRAVDTCSAASATLLAAIDSSPAEIGRLAEQYGLDVDNREGLEGAGSYVAICAYDASEFDALADGLSVFSLWESDGFGNGVLAVW